MGIRSVCESAGRGAHGVRFDLSPSPYQFAAWPGRVRPLRRTAPAGTTAHEREQAGGRAAYVCLPSNPPVLPEVLMEHKGARSAPPPCVSVTIHDRPGHSPRRRRHWHRRGLDPPRLRVRRRRHRTDRAGELVLVLGTRRHQQQLRPGRRSIRLGEAPMFLLLGTARKDQRGRLSLRRFQSMTS